MTTPPVAVLSALADEHRLVLLDRLGRSGPASASALARESTMTRQGVLKHLTVLFDAGLVERRRHGREVVFETATAPLLDTARWLESTSRAWDRRLHDLKHRAEQEWAEQEWAEQD